MTKRKAGRAPYGPSLGEMLEQVEAEIDRERRAAVARGLQSPAELAATTKRIGDLMKRAKELREPKS